MSEQQQTQEKSRIQSEFEALPLDEKFSSLLKMEAATLSESFNYVVDSSSKAFEKMGEVFTDLSSKVETEFKKAKATGGKEPPVEPAQSTPKAKKTPPKSSDK